MTKTNRYFRGAEGGERSAAPVTRARPGAAPPPTLIEALQRAGVDSFAGEPENLAALEIGERIRAARQAAGLTQDELAARTGCKQGDLSNIERGKGRDGPSYRTLQTIATALQVDLPVYALSVLTPKLMFEPDIDLERISYRIADLDVLQSLFSHVEMDGLWERMQVSLAKLKSIRGQAWRPSLYRACHLVQIAPGSTVQFSYDADLSMLCKVRGSGTVEVRRPLARYPDNGPGPALAALDQESQAEIRTSAKEGLTLVMLPSSVLTSNTFGPTSNPP